MESVVIMNDTTYVSENQSQCTSILSLGVKFRVSVLPGFNSFTRHLHASEENIAAYLLYNFSVARVHIITKNLYMMVFLIMCSFYSSKYATQLV